MENKTKTIDERCENLRSEIVNNYTLIGEATTRLLQNEISISEANRISNECRGANKILESELLELTKPSTSVVTG